MKNDSKREMNLNSNIRKNEKRQDKRKKGDSALSSTCIILIGIFRLFYEFCLGILATLQSISLHHPGLDYL